MQQLTQEGRHAVAEIAARYQLSQEAVEHMLVAVNNGGGSMAQFNCPELGGSGQWMRGGMTMVGDMFNHNLKSTVDRLCNDLSNLLANTRVFPAMAAGGGGNAQWWPEKLGRPISSGSQNNTRYAVFADRLAVDKGGAVTVYDTRGHQIGGVSQQQGGHNSLTFSSQFGTISVDGLPVVSIGDNQESDPADPESVSQSSTGQADSTAETQGQQHLNTAPQIESSVSRDSGNSSGGGDSNASGYSSSSLGSQSGEQAGSSESGTISGTDVVALIEKLAQLHDAGILNDEEFSAKKRELLARL